jgi:TolB-like protein/Tfp pilus assembly protein PilF
MYINGASAYCNARQFDKAIDHCRRAQAFAPHHSIADWGLGYIYNLKQMHEKALTFFEGITDTHSSIRDGFRGYIYAKMGKETKARHILNDLKIQVKHGTVSHAALAVVHLGLGEHDKALDYLERAVEERPAVSIITSYLKVDPLWDPLRSDRRFIAILKKMGFDVAEVEPSKSKLTVSRTVELKPSESKPPDVKPSIAVLPFVDMSPQKDQEYFCDGIAEELINALTNVKDMHVVARTSAFSFKGEKLDVREIGKKLNVNNVLEGSIRKSGNRVRITAQLINVEDGYHLWSEKFDRDMDDIFAIQDEISLSIVEKLKIKLLGAEKAEILKRYTENMEAYNLFLTGEHFLHKRTAEGFQKAVACYEEALALDPNYAPAYRGLASVNILYGFWGNRSPHSTYPKAREYLKKALEIDEGYVDAHWALAEVNAFYDWRWDEAEKRFKHTLQLNPNSSYAHLYFSMMLTILGRHDEAVAEAMRSCELDPLSAAVTGFAGHALYKAGRYDEALEHTEKTLSIHPNSFVHHFVLGYVYQKNSMYEKAIDHFEKSVALSGNASMIMSLLAKAYNDSGNKAQAEILLEALKERRLYDYVPPICFFHIYFSFGDQGKAEEWLRGAYDEHDGFLLFYVNTMDENYRIPHTAPFLETIKKMGLVK